MTHCIVIVARGALDPKWKRELRDRRLVLGWFAFCTSVIGIQLAIFHFGNTSDLYAAAGHERQRRHYYLEQWRE